jgi:membrane-associated phospholipid phosphatase
LDQRLLSALRDCGQFPPVLTAARLLSWSGEHGALWLAAGLVGAAVDKERKGAWLRGTTVTFAAHAVSMGIKIVVRRPRPGEAAPLVWTSGRHSFPSSHATAAAAAAVAFGAFSPTGAVVLPPLAAAMCVSRMVVGVHYPTDVVAGAALGAVTAKLGAPWMFRALVTAGPMSAALTSAPVTAAVRGASEAGAAVASRAGASVVSRAARWVDAAREVSQAVRLLDAAREVSQAVAAVPRQRRMAAGPSASTPSVPSTAAVPKATTAVAPAAVTRVRTADAFGRTVPRTRTAGAVPRRRRPARRAVPRLLAGAVLVPVLGALLGPVVGPVTGACMARVR